MTREQAVAALRAAGYKVTVPPVQRQTLVESANVRQPKPWEPLVESESNPRIYQHGSYLQEQLNPSNWAALADRSQPLPQGMNPDFALREMSNFLALEISDREERQGGY